MFASSAKSSRHCIIDRTRQKQQESKFTGLAKISKVSRRFGINVSSAESSRYRAIDVTLKRSCQRTQMKYSLLSRKNISSRGVYRSEFFISRNHHRGISPLREPPTHSHLRMHSKFPVVNITENIVGNVSRSSSVTETPSFSRAKLKLNASERDRVAGDPSAGSTGCLPFVVRENDPRLRVALCIQLLAGAGDEKEPPATRWSHFEVLPRESTTPPTTTSDPKVVEVSTPPHIEAPTSSSSISRRLPTPVRAPILNLQPRSSSSVALSATSAGCFAIII